MGIECSALNLSNFKPERSEGERIGNAGLFRVHQAHSKQHQLMSAVTTRVAITTSAPSHSLWAEQCRHKGAFAAW